MPLIVENAMMGFDTAQIGRGDLIRAKYHSWSEARNGIVAAVRPEKLLVVFLSGPGSCTNYFPILPDEVIAGKWTVTWTRDFDEIQKEGPDGDAGGADLPQIGGDAAGAGGV